MAKKRLTCDIEEDLHSSLKEKAAKEGVPLGALCSSLLSAGLKYEIQGGTATPALPITELYASMPLDDLRKEVMSLGTEKPQGWEAAVRKANMEIVRRYKIK